MESELTQPRALLFVCTGNLCRSPAAETMFNALTQERGLGWRAQSAGLSAVEGELVPENARVALEEVGFYAGKHRARRLQSRMVERADLVLTMTPGHREKVARLCNGLTEGKVHTLLGYLGDEMAGEISDPHGYPISMHRASVRQIYGYVERLVKHLHT